MFAPPIAKAQTKAAASAASQLAPQHSTRATRPLAAAVEQVHRRQPSLGNRGARPLLSQRRFDLSGDASGSDPEQESEPASLTAQVIKPGLTWDFTKIPLSPPEPASPARGLLRLASVPLAAAIQAKPVNARIGAVDDPLEREADQVAERVIAGEPAGAIGGAPSYGVQRQCAACETEEEQQIHRKEQGSAHRAPGDAGAEAAVDAVSSGGMPLSVRDRAYFEPRFGRDFANVRLHTHARAAAAAADIQARAYTWQNHIAFAAAEFSPGGLEGRRLLAHELAHVAQQVPHIARQAGPPFYTRTFRDDQGGAALDYTETVQVAPTRSTAGIEGSVDRSVFAPASGTQPRQMTHHGQVNHIRLTPDCRIVVPYRIQFQPQQVAAGVGICQSPPNATPVNPLPAARLQAIQTRYVTAMNAGLNNRYAVRVTGCRSAQPCTDRPLPVEIAAEAVTNNPDTTVNVVNRGGRADAATICAGSFDDLLPVHEGGHQALGAPDEYQETDPAVIAAANATGLHWERGERVRSDLSGMTDQDAYGRFMLFHERHFRFAQVFLEAVLQGQNCTVSLESVSRSPLEFRVDLGLGAAATNRGVLPYASLFLGAGIPLERRRRLMFLFGARGQVFSDLGYQDQNAFMAGLHLGVEAQTNPANFGLYASLSATGGGLYAPAATPPSFSALTPSAARFSPYGEAGGSLGVHTGLSSSWEVRAGAEAAAGREVSGDPHALSWWRLGFVVGISR